MSRRAMYAFGALLDPEPKQFVTLGAAIGMGKRGMTISYISPTDPITETGQVRTIAGLTFEFLDAPDTEAPEEMHIWIPRAEGSHLCRERQSLPAQHPDAGGAHRRRAELRPLSRSGPRAVGCQAEVHYGPHTWPVWGNENIVAFLEEARAVIAPPPPRSRDEHDLAGRAACLCCAM